TSAAERLCTRFPARGDPARQTSRPQSTRSGADVLASVCGFCTTAQEYSNVRSQPRASPTASTSNNLTSAERPKPPRFRDEEARRVALIRLDVMAEPAYTVKALDASTWAAFAALVERNNGIFGGCWCMGFHDDDSRTDPEHNRAAKERRVRDGRAHAALVYDGDDCVGWCQFGAPGEVPRIKNRAAYDKGQTASPDWRIPSPNA